MEKYKVKRDSLNRAGMHASKVIITAQNVCVCVCVCVAKLPTNSHPPIYTCMEKVRVNACQMK